MWKESVTGWYGKQYEIEMILVANYRIRFEGFLFMFVLSFSLSISLSLCVGCVLAGWFGYFTTGKWSNKDIFISVAVAMADNKQQTLTAKCYYVNEL